MHYYIINLATPVADYEVRIDALTYSIAGIFRIVNAKEWAVADLQDLPLHTQLKLLKQIKELKQKNETLNNR